MPQRNKDRNNEGLLTSFDVASATMTMMEAQRDPSSINAESAAGPTSTQDVSFPTLLSFFSQKRGI